MPIVDAKYIALLGTIVSMDTLVVNVFALGSMLLTKNVV